MTDPAEPKPSDLPRLREVGDRVAIHELAHDLINLIEEKDASTVTHTWRVVLYTRAMCEEHGLSRAYIEKATLGAALHDVGKLDIPAEILQKPARLTDEEFEVIKQHPVTGYARMVQCNIDDPVIVEIVRAHHEKWDGTGYPFGLRGDDIPVIARYFAVIDTFDALTSIRPYRKEVGAGAARRALDILEMSKGTHFWPEAVEMFTRLYKDGKLDYILHHFNDQASVARFGSSEGQSKLTKNLAG